MNKMQMAHDMALELVKIKPSLSAWQIADRCFEYADAMQAEADKREDKTRPDVLKEEWQPDWSQAPRWANWWVATADSNGEISGGWFYEFEPDIGDGTENSHSVYYSRGSESSLTESFGYTGNWKASLRKRPQ